MDVERMRVGAPHAEDGAAENRHDPVHRAVRRPSEPEQARGDEDGAGDGGREPILGLVATWLAPGGLARPDQTLVLTVPERVRRDAEHHADEHAEEGQADLVQLEVVFGLEDDGERAEEEVDEPEQQG